MPSSTAAGRPWPEPWRLALGAAVAFGLALGAAAWWGRALVEALLPAAATGLGCLDERFSILFLGLDQSHQDTVVRARMGVARMIVVDGHLTVPDARGWLEVSTPAGSLLQPLVIALGVAGAWPAPLRARVARAGIAGALGLAFLVVDLPVTLHAYVWQLFAEHYEPGRLSPLLAWTAFLHDGGRLGMGVLLGLAACRT